MSWAGHGSVGNVPAMHHVGVSSAKTQLCPALTYSMLDQAVVFQAMPCPGMLHFTNSFCLHLEGKR